jgi:hypothetical protein
MPFLYRLFFENCGWFYGAISSYLSSAWEYVNELIGFLIFLTWRYGAASGRMFMDLHHLRMIWMGWGLIRFQSSKYWRIPLLGTLRLPWPSIGPKIKAGGRFKPEE